MECAMDRMEIKCKSLTRDEKRSENSFLKLESL